MTHARLRSQRQIVFSQAVLVWSKASGEEIMDFIRYGILPGADGERVEPYNEDEVRRLASPSMGA